MRTRRFKTVVEDDKRGGALIRVPFDPDEAWGTKPVHLIAGTVNGLRVRGAVELHGGVPGFRLGPAWLRDRSLKIGDEASVEIEPEGPQRDDLADDLASACKANPKAAEFFDSIAQFYRKGYLRWIDATKRRPEVRVERIATMVELLNAGVKDYRNR
jgi:hypothetical protein